MSDHVRDVTERAELTGCLVIWLLFRAFSLLTILCSAANKSAGVAQNPTSSSSGRMEN